MVEPERPSDENRQIELANQQGDAPYKDISTVESPKQ